MSKWLLAAWLMAVAPFGLAREEVTNLPLNELTPYFGDLDEIVERRRLRVLVPYGRTLYFIDGGVQRGIAFEIMEGKGVREKGSRKRGQVLFLEEKGS